MATQQEEAIIMNKDRAEQAASMIQALEKMGVSTSIHHDTGESSYPTEYTLHHATMRATGPTVPLALLAFVERLLALNKRIESKQVSHMKTHTLYESSRVPGRFALDGPEGATISTFEPLMLKVGHTWLSGHAESDGQTYWFIPAGGNYRDDRIALHAGMTISQRSTAHEQT